ncbi:6-phosphogluconolactonase [Puniceicoccales bacterium CK1056]|uniref:6-phosphogluconolactonase n=1 Tax=Oceanipulchritudo coccoides TaxID=2706888 RepID=A0A6B2M1K1_9BACT|nr:6-phosphogluconolactonase [Oceanipulchritudo coccoides]NDV61665.1 6-phosphogluconolactonase [Oceanipulchritudo coccoides]
MRHENTPYGRLCIGSLPELYTRLVDHFETTAGSSGDAFTVGLTGGSTPKAFYEWAVASKALSDVVRRHAVWSVSDERMVPLSDSESNFGTADRQWLTPMGVAPERKFPWPVMVDPHSAAAAFQMRWQERFGSERAFDLCLLGMGDDGHTASIFPGSPLLIVDSGDYFAPVDVPGKGWRLSITPDGLAACGKIVVMVTGAAKAERLKAVLEGPEGVYPVQLLSRFSEKVEWLVDELAMA